MRVKLEEGILIKDKKRSAFGICRTETESVMDKIRDNKEEHIKLLRECGFRSVDLLWTSYLQAGFWAVK